jgi:hypothetical protein
MAAVARGLHRTHAAGVRSLARCALAPASHVPTLAVAHGRCGHRAASLWAGRDAQRGESTPAVGLGADRLAARWALVSGDLAPHDGGGVRSEAPVENFHETSLRLALGGGHEGSAARGRAEHGLMQLFAKLDTPGILRVGVPAEVPDGAREGPDPSEEPLHDETRPYGTLEWPSSVDLRDWVGCDLEGRGLGNRACLHCEYVRPDACVYAASAHCVR